MGESSRKKKVRKAIDALSPVEAQAVGNFYNRLLLYIAAGRDSVRAAQKTADALESLGAATDLVKNACGGALPPAVETDLRAALKIPAPNPALIGVEELRHAVAKLDNEAKK